MTISPKQVAFISLDFPEAERREQIAERIRELQQPVKDELPAETAERLKCIEVLRGLLAKG